MAEGHGFWGLHWPTVGVISTALLGWAAAMWRGGALVWRGASRMKSLEAEVHGLRAALTLAETDRKVEARRFEAIVEAFRAEFMTARRERDNEMQEIRGMLNNTLERVHTRIDAVDGALRDLQGYLRAKSESKGT